MRVRVVVREDLAVAETVARISLRTPLAHADPVTPTLTVDDENRARRRNFGNREGGEQDRHQDPHLAAERVAIVSPGRFRCTVT